MDGTIEKRKSVILSKEESEILKWIYVKTLIPMGLAIVVSSAVLYIGLKSLMTTASFTNYGIAPTGSMERAAKFIYTYIFIAASNIVIVIALSAVVIYLVLHDLVLPIMRVTRELKETVDARKKKIITIRTTDRLLKPLVDLINKLIA